MLQLRLRQLMMQKTNQRPRKAARRYLEDRCLERRQPRRLTDDKDISRRI